MYKMEIPDITPLNKCFLFLVKLHTIVERVIRNWKGNIKTETENILG